MGGAKRDLMHADDIGWVSSHHDKYVCVSCIEDPGLQEVVKRHLENETCSYCGDRRRKLIAAPLDKVTEHIAECISRVYMDAESLPYDSEDGSYWGTAYTTQELLIEDVDFSVENAELFDDVCS